MHANGAGRFRVHDYQLDIFLNTVPFDRLSEQNKRWVKDHVKRINRVLKKFTSEQVKQL
jgi:hypothetical protein